LVVMDWELILQYNARILELRSYWLDIVNTSESVYNERKNRTQQFSYFSIVWMK